jgi:hypothetical protein
MHHLHQLLPLPHGGGVGPTAARADLLGKAMRQLGAIREWLICVSLQPGPEVIGSVTREETLPRRDHGVRRWAAWVPDPL